MRTSRPMQNGSRQASIADPAKEARPVSKECLLCERFEQCTSHDPHAGCPAQQVPGGNVEYQFMKVVS